MIRNGRLNIQQYILYVLYWKTIIILKLNYTNGYQHIIVNNQINQKSRNSKNKTNHNTWSIYINQVILMVLANCQVTPIVHIIITIIIITIINNKYGST